MLSNWQTKRSDRLLIFLMLFLVSACHGKLSPGSPNSQVQLPSAKCQAVKHDIGNTKICGQPQKVAALSPLILDIMLALDIQPAGYAESSSLHQRQFNNPSQEIPYLGSRVTTQPLNLGSRDRPSLEALAKLKPDLILGETWHNQSNYDLLSRISPTVLIDNEKGGWQRTIQVIAQAFGREEQAQQIIAAQKQQIATARTQLAPVIAAYPRVLVIAANQMATSIFLDSYASTTAKHLEAIGFELVFLKNVQRTPGIRPQISIETLPELDADIIMIMVWDEKLDFQLESVKTLWYQQPILLTMKAFQEGRVYFVDYQLWGSNIHGPIADELILQKLPQLLLLSQR
ncbi:MAG: ABC transporter substrate-binding protein [Nodularia sp. CChRGM 3473]